jgi:hypothetical protein
MVCCSDRVVKYARLDISILLTCRQAYSEGIMILYNTTNFQFFDHHDFVAFLTPLPPRYSDAIRSLEVRWRVVYEDENMDRLFWKFLLELPNLHEVFIAIGEWECKLNIAMCLDPFDELARKRGTVLEKLRVVVPYKYFELGDKRNKDVQKKINATQFFWRARRVVSDDSSNQQFYSVESRASCLAYKAEALNNGYHT